VKKTTPVQSLVKLATPKAAKEPPGEAKRTDPAAKPIGADSGGGNSQAGSGDATNPGGKGGPGAAGGSDAVMLGYFKKVEAHFRREWKKPLTAVRSGRSVEAFVRLRAASDGTVESLKLVKPTGNSEVDQSIEQALRRVTKVESPPAELLKNGHLDEMVEFVLEL
jgi:TonB family protein